MNINFVEYLVYSRLIQSICHISFSQIALVDWPSVNLVGCLSLLVLYLYIFRTPL